MINCLAILPRKSVQVVGGEIANALANFVAKERHPFRESEVFVDQIALWLQDSRHLVEGILPIGDVVRHHVGGDKG